MERLTTFAAGRLDRAGEYRADPGWVAERLAEPAARAVALTDGRVLLDAGDDGRLARFALAEVGGEPVLLGLLDGEPLFAVAVEDAPGGRPMGLREAARLLSADEGAYAAQAAGLLNWHRSHPHCSRCGARTVMAEAGYVRSCPACGAVHHPRTDPVVIMLVEDGDRILLGRNAAWPPGRYSTLAGFVEPGETPEAAVAREVREEANVDVRAPRYVAAQPWPFPSSLMLGFAASYAGGELDARDGELEDARWFSRADVEDAVAGRGGYRLPPAEAIARFLIDHWRAGELP